MVLSTCMIDLSPSVLFYMWIVSGNVSFLDASQSNQVDNED
jgi:hypothetical protein